MKIKTNLIAAALGLILGVLPALAANETNVVWGLSAGANPRSLCLYDVSATRPCNVLATVDATNHAIALNVPGTGGFFANTQNAVINRINDRLFIGGAALNDGNTPNGNQDWMSVLQLAEGLSTGSVGSAQVAILPPSTVGLHALVVGLQSLGTGNVATQSAAVNFFAWNNNATLATYLWGLYGEAHRINDTVGGTYGFELDVRQLGSNAVNDPYTQSTKATTALILAAGAGVTSVGQFNATTAIEIKANPMPFNNGLMFDTGGIATSTPDTKSHAIVMPVLYYIDWYSAAATIAGSLTVDSSNKLQIGASGGLVVNGCAIDSTSSLVCTSASAFMPQFVMANVTNDANAGYLLMRKQHDVVGAVVASDALGTIIFQGYASGANQNTAYIQAFVNGTPSGANIPTAMRFHNSDAAGVNLSDMLWDTNAHLSFTSSGVPVISACGTTPSAATGTDNAGQVTEGTTAIGCTITFKVAFVSAPFCTVSPQAALTSFAYTLSTTAITVTHSSASSVKLNWVCNGK